MSLVPVYRICPKCKNKYSWNPDAGEMFCPRCGPFSFLNIGSFSLKSPLLEILAKKKDKRGRMKGCE